jgi:hypothetical protein
MAHDPGPCGPQYEDWEAAYKDFQNKDAEAVTRFGASMGLAAVGVGVCGALWWTGLGLIGCGAAAGGSIVNSWVSVRASRATSAAAGRSNKARDKYHDCVSQHKWYYGEQKK